MKATKFYQLEKYQFSENKENVDSATIESWEDTSAVTFFGIDGNELFASSIDKINDDEYPEWTIPFLEAINLLC